MKGVCTIGNQVKWVWVIMFTNDEGIYYELYIIYMMSNLALLCTFKLRESGICILEQLEQCPPSYKKIQGDKENRSNIQKYRSTIFKK